MTLQEILSEIHQSGRIMGSKPKGEDIQADIDWGIAAITALIPGKRKLKPIHYYPDVESNREIEAYNDAIDTIQRNFTGQTDNEREQQ